MDKTLETAWNGEGLPPVGTVCEYSLNNGATWFQCKIEFIVGTQGVVMSGDVSEGVQYLSEFWNKPKFRPIPTPEQIEAERRERVIEQMMNAWRDTKPHHPSIAGVIYDAIRAGKIEGVKIDG